ncbi:pyrroloquinoline quinone precursor peptide PqqA [Aquamicrobium sp. LC103]|nr:pyrroloquinoline quinone precursor peptide PqqA [Aquamicrobium sp. LC103]
MKKTWTKPTMCQVAAGLEISRYLPAELGGKKK